MTHRPPQSIAKTGYNAAAGQLLRRARQRAGCDQVSFAALLSALLGVQVSASSLSYAESGAKTCSAAVLLAAVALSGGTTIRVEKANRRELWQSIVEKANGAA